MVFQLNVLKEIIIILIKVECIKNVVLWNNVFIVIIPMMVLLLTDRIPRRLANNNNFLYRDLPRRNSDGAFELLIDFALPRLLYICLLALLNCRWQRRVQLHCAFIFSDDPFSFRRVHYMKRIVHLDIDFVHDRSPVV